MIENNPYISIANFRVRTSLLEKRGAILLAGKQGDGLRNNLIN